jgi:hypothetical protein
VGWNNNCYKGLTSSPTSAYVGVYRGVRERQCNSEPSDDFSLAVNLAHYVPGRWRMRGQLPVVGFKARGGGGGCHQM